MPWAGMLQSLGDWRLGKLTAIPTGKILLQIYQLQTPLPLPFQKAKKNRYRYKHLKMYIIMTEMTLRKLNFPFKYEFYGFRKSKSTNVATNILSVQIYLLI